MGRQVQSKKSGPLVPIRTPEALPVLRLHQLLLGLFDGHELGSLTGHNPNRFRVGHSQHRAVALLLEPGSQIQVVS
jgi:hypothetical protein